MHELPVTEDILRIATEEAQKHQATQVTDIYLTIGKLSSIIDDSVQFYWDHISKGTICEGATLHFKRPPAVMRCVKCQTEFELLEELLPCPNCGSFELNIVSGDEMHVDHIDIIMEDNND
jgi:hydrogenase nickel incorporation protein HypA/HybF